MSRFFVCTILGHAIDDYVVEELRPGVAGYCVATCSGTQEEGATRIRTAERKLIIAAGQNWIRKLRRRTRTPRGAIITTSRCLVDTSKDRDASLAEPQYLVGLYVVNDIYILIEKEK